MSGPGIVTLSVAYGLPALVVGCRITSLLAWNWRSVYNSKWFNRHTQLTAPSCDQWFGGACIGMLGALVWPLVLGVYLGRSVLFAPPPDVVRERQRARIAQLEHELGIAGEGEHSRASTSDARCRVSRCARRRPRSPSA